MRKILLLLGVVLFLLTSVFIPYTLTVPAEDRSISWESNLNFSETTGETDYVIFGEAPDARDGPPADIYDVAKPPAPMVPYIRAYLKDNLPNPYTLLWSDYREYPDTMKVWNLSIRWEPADGESPTMVTISWNTTEVGDSEYTAMNLCTSTGVVLQNMLVTTMYTFSCPASSTQNFKIICSGGNTPPILGVPSPVNGSTGNSLSLNWNIPISDPNGDTFSWTAQCTNGQSNSGSGATNGTKSLVLSGLAYSTTYAVWVNATDPAGSGLYTRRWFTFTTKANTPPAYGQPNPANASGGNSLTLSWSILITDEESFNWTIQCSNGQTNSAAGASTGIKSLSLSGLGYSMTYKVWVNATDPPPTGSGLYTRKWYMFTTKPEPWVNRPPTFSNPSPVNESTGVNRYHATNVTVSDLDGNVTTICFWYGASSSGPWTLTQRNSSVIANTTVRDLNSSYSNGWATQYWWRVTADDGHVNSSVIYTFTTKAKGNNPPVFGAPSPGNGSAGNSLSVTWNIAINDLEGNTFNWTIQCSNKQVANANGSSNGTKSLALTGLAYLTTYKIWVNATDPTGSKMYTRKWFIFTTKSSGGSPPPPPPGGGGTTENQNPKADLSAGEPYGGFVNTAITFNGSKSLDSDGTITRWMWDFGDTTNATGTTVQHIYFTIGTFTVTLTVTDNDGATNTDTTTCVITQQNNSQQNRQPTPPVINGTRTGKKNTMYTYSVSSVDQDNDSLQYTITWGDGNQNTSGFIPNGTLFSLSHSWGSPGIYMITATATDTITGSEQTIFSIFIDAYFVRELGFLFDSNNDGFNDSFYTNGSGLITTVQNLADGNYLLDTDADGRWEYTYNPSIDSLTEMDITETTTGFPWLYLALIIVILVVVSIACVVYLYRYGYI